MVSTASSLSGVLSDRLNACSVAFGKLLERLDRLFQVTSHAASQHHQRMKNEEQRLTISAHPTAFLEEGAYLSVGTANISSVDLLRPVAAAFPRLRRSFDSSLSGVLSDRLNACSVAFGKLLERLDRLFQSSG